MANPDYPKSDTPTWLYSAFADNLNWAIPMRTLVTLKNTPTVAAIWTGEAYFWSLM